MALILKQKVTKYTLLRDKYFKSIEATFKLSKDPDKKNEFLSRSEKIEVVYESFDNAQLELIELSAELPSANIQVAEVSTKCEEMYYDVLARRRELLPPPQSNPPMVLGSAGSSCGNHDTKPRIPKIQIEPFAGAVEQFASFKSLFDTLIHASPISDIEKFSYLLSLLKDKALNSIKSIEFNSNNYQRAYEKLCEEYSNPRLIATHYLNKILSIKAQHTESPQALRQFLDGFYMDTEAITDLKLADLADFIFLHVALKSIPLETRRMFEHENIGAAQIPTLHDLMVHIKNRLAILEMSPHEVRKPPTAAVNVHHRSSFMTMSSSEQRPRDNMGACPVCSSKHRIHQCKEFLAMDVSQRYEAVKATKLCFSCLGPHPRTQCQTTYSCRTCHDRTHHTLLHAPAANNQNKSRFKPSYAPASTPPYNHISKTSNVAVFATSLPSPTLQSVESSPTLQSLDSSPEAQALACNQSSSTTVLLGTAMAQVQCSSGLWHKVRVVLDPGSMVDFISSSLAKTLNLSYSASNNRVTGLGHTPVSTMQSCVNVCLAPINTTKMPMLTIKALIIPTISADIPVKRVPIEISNRFENLADYSIFQKASKVDILLGAAHLSDILLPGQPIVPGKPSCWPTVFGNVLLGEIPTNDSPPCSQSLFVTAQNDFLSNQLKLFWENEELPAKKFCSAEDMSCEKHFEETHSRNELGQFVVRLPFKGNTPPDLGSTRDIAMKQFERLEKRLDLNPQMKTMYHNNLQSYILENQIDVATSRSPYVLPHHAVMKESSSSPLRIVFNASQTSNTGITLNESMYTGPKLQHDVGDIIVSFRLHAIALCADIRQMYRCILLHPDDRQYQHIFWRFDQKDPILEWELKRLTFGFAPASYLAQKCLRTLAITEKDKWPNACHVLTNDCYIDDIVTGAENVESAQQLRQDLVDLLQSGGFELKKFSSSSPAVLSDVPVEDQQSLLLHDDSSIKVLGLRWDPIHDAFCYTINIKSPDVVTKRSLLSNIASIFDVNGYLTHLVIFLKILMQKIWLSKAEWDDPLPSHLLNEWNDFIQELPCLEDLKIPRYVASPIAMSFQLIGFSDASSSAIAALVYLRIQCSDGSVIVNLLRAKSKVAPLKTISIPRLELSAAHRLVQVLNSLENLTKSLKIDSITCFSDSTTTLSWLQTPPHQLKTFVANRVAEVIEKVHPTQWRYVPTAKNPADLATRGLLPSQVIANYDFWFHGPGFLVKEPESWPAFPNLPINEDLPEMKPKVSLVVQDAPATTVQPELLQFIGKFSSLSKLQRIVAWILRFKSNCQKKKSDRNFGPLTPQETLNALTTCVKVHQQFYFADVIKRLNKGQPIDNCMKNLSPFINPSSLLMVGGRLKNSPLPESSKHPLLLSSKCHLTSLIVHYYHLYSLHGSARIVQSLIQRYFWIVGARNLIKKSVFSCLKCYKLTAIVRAPYMGDIPVSRFAQGRCFINTAIDFAGPFMLKTGTRRNSPIVKSYMVVFVCMATKAVHLELANSLTMESCLAAIDRFIARRGKPCHIYSDQGTNFKASARHISEVQKVLKLAHPQLTEQLSVRGMQWHFHPPGAPNFSGLVEAGVKSAKYHLKRILDGRALYHEELVTLLCQVEATLNSRVLGFISSIPDDGFDYLTPGHFLTGAPLLARPEFDVTDEVITPLCRWKLVTKMNQTFWKRWSSEYLHSQIQRTKWQKKTSNLKIDDVVFIIGENVPPRDWAIARVTKLYPGPDGVVRVAEVQWAHGVLTRPVSKLLPLPVL